MILEVLHANGTRTWHRVGALPLTLGRGFANDLILDDPYVDAQHARLVRDGSGAFVLQDLGSVNGIVTNSTRRFGSIALGPGDTVRVGRTTLRIHDPNEAVAPALSDESHAAPLPHVRQAMVEQPRWITRKQVTLLVALLAAVVFSIYTWLGNTERSSTSDVFSTTLGLTIIVAAWAAIWAGVSRVVIHRFNFGGHVVLASTIFVAALGIVIVQEWLTFLFPDSGAVTAFGAIVNLALVSSLVSAHLSLSSTLPRRRRWQIGLAVAVAIFGIGGAFSIADKEPFSDVPVFSGMIKPLAADLVPTSPVAEFAPIARGLKEQVDAMATK
jgi:hypothetical protein